MLKAYINYPNSYITVHGKAACAAVRQRHKLDQRIVRIDVATFSRELNHFVMKEHRFGSQAETNDMWLELDFGDSKFEKAVVDYIQTLLAPHYKPFSRVKIDEHC